MTTLNGTYSEQVELLNKWTTLKISQHKTSLSFYIAGPDRRYNGKFYDLSVGDVQKLISSIKNGWERYQKLLTLDLPGGVFECVGSYVYVNTGEYRKGVEVFDSRYLFMNNEEDINKLILQLEDCISRANILKDKLFGK